MDKKKGYYDYVDELSASIKEVTKLSDKGLTKEADILAKEVYAQITKVSRRKEVPDFIWRDIGIQFYLLQDFENAEKALVNAKNEAVKLVEEGQKILSPILGDLAMVYEAMQKYRLACELYQQEVELRESYHGNVDSIKFAKDNFERVKKLAEKNS